MKKGAILLTVVMAMLSGAAFRTQGQVVITSEDMFLDEGLYYRAYSNGSLPVPAPGFIGQAGGPNFWDFTDVPTDEVIHFEYLEAAASVDYQSFPGATIMERSTNETTGELMGEIYFEPVQGVGRKVYGFVRDSGNALEQLLGLAGPLPFSSPQIDFPANIKYGDTWSNTLIFQSNRDDSEDGIIGSVGEFRIVQTDDFTVDAYGFADLPELGIVDVLRINTISKTDVQMRQDQSFVTFGPPSYVRIYRWLAKGKGIVVELASNVTADLSGNASPPPAVFETAGHIFTMFETNKVPTGGGCLEADPVVDLRITYDDANNRVFLRWSKVDCASFYRVQYTTGLGNGHTWQTIEQTNKDFSLDIVPDENEMRMYRVVSVLE